MKYHVYGIGNALVDKEFEVTESFLAENGIEKGLMTLIEEDQLSNLLANLKESFGLKKRAGGGSAANTIVAISQLGGNTFYACKVADDETGDFYMKDLAVAGVTTKLDQIKGDGITGKCLVMVTDDAERTMNTYLGITSDFSVDDLHIEDLINSEFLYIEGYLVTSDVSRNAAIEARNIAKQNNVKTAFTFSDPAMVTYFKEGVSEIIGEGVDVLFCNEEEACTYTGKENLDDAILDLQKITDKLVVTLGSKGAMVISKDKQVNIEANKVTAIDTNGAGDMFAGAFMYGLTQGMSDHDAGKLASESAARTVATFGARLDKEVLQSVLAKYMD
ncbi:adenosine kinase [uncultured Cocleimonas sp.]|uniref:adenosine kinase n=1 Tax=uncultured Cocleimonas sp. TaxID=1051587 RepID=UPI00262AC2FB|nr:adenosine kinase [uncultured Cocleimonas sp.]